MHTRSGIPPNKPSMQDLVKDASFALAILALSIVIMHMDLSWMFHVETPSLVSIEQLPAP